MRPSTRTGVVAAAVAVLVVGAGVTWYARAGDDTAPPAAAAATSISASTTPSADPSTATPTPTLVLPSPSPKPAASKPPSKKPTPSAPAAKPSPSSHPRPTATPFRFPVPVSVGNARQVVTVSASGSYANVVAWQRTSSGWKAVIQTRSARIGANGLVAATQRKQGTNTTPAGTFTMTEAFGIAANPGAKLPYHQVTTDDWWVEDNNSAYYNTMRRASQGGFAVTTAGENGSEHLISFTTQYRYVVVINFNRPPNAVRHRGAGIFLHVNGPGATAGCVSVPQSTMLAIITWLDPAQHPRIAIG
jgi:L,D-peptidoglycan transpeptidase YkuD (ErfK/YbiS/YcfS/YnhG family)